MYAFYDDDGNKHVNYSLDMLKVTIPINSVLLKKPYPVGKSG